MLNIYWFISRLVFTPALYHLSSDSNRKQKPENICTSGPFCLTSPAQKGKQFQYLVCDDENRMQQQDLRWGKFLVFGREIILKVYWWSLQSILKGTGWAHPALVLVWTFLPAIPNFGVQNNNNLLHIIVNSVHSNIFWIPWEEVKVDFHSYDNST